ncbi:glycosyltransferase [Saccharicrinis aurantiacus]|uniref:glycosyltransferase n=1 Tax=Saccharicrinis aurantiacus TaxID=1849719 RepID=UPI002492AA15|nr:glycosyltransferase [Saccharicrinis aurantiacus]
MIYLIDTIGKEVGMHLYNNAFVTELRKFKIQTTVLSNYKTDNSIEYIPNFYKKKRIQKVLTLISTLFRFLILIIKKKENVFIYQSYGMRNIDILFSIILSISKSSFIIVHDVYTLTPNNKIDKNKKIKNLIYKYFVKRIICHSDQTKNILSNIGYKGDLILFPHFNYSFNKNIKKEELKSDIINSIKKDKLNLLFFGQISLTKGIDILIDSLNYINPEINLKLNIIIAGVDKSNLITKKKLPPNVLKICRYINDSELNYLFTKTDFLLLPYKKIYQSGVLDTAVYFEKPSLLSDIKYFRDFNINYPSFSLIVSTSSAIAYAESIENLTKLNLSDKFFTKPDLNKYKADHNCSQLVNDINTALSKQFLHHRLSTHK